MFLYAVSCCDKCAGKYTVFSVTFAVVPRKGDVDRNPRLQVIDGGNAVVPRKGDVDRNVVGGVFLLGPLGVVPRKGDVDRNEPDAAMLSSIGESSPARGTWIEIDHMGSTELAANVVPRKGDVDRNNGVAMAPAMAAGRPPQGGRG